jgi:hypothetical protein
LAGDVAGVAVGHTHDLQRLSGLRLGTCSALPQARNPAWGLARQSLTSGSVSGSHLLSERGERRRYHSPGWSKVRRSQAVRGRYPTHR